MKGFVLISAAMTVAAVLWVVVPLIRRREAGGFGGGESNLAILRTQLAELGTDLANGTISAEQYASAKSELERRVLEESTGGDEAIPSASGGRGGVTAWILAALIPLTAASLYFWIGQPDGLRSEALSAEQQASPTEVDEMVARLAARLEKNPDDPRGWMMLARSYYVMQRMPEAVVAFEKAALVVKDDPDFYADYADALAVSQGRRLDGKPLQLVQLALKIDPVHPKALAMAGSEAFFRKDYQGALAYWEKLQPLLPPDSEMGKSIESSIAEARELGGIKAPAKSAGAASANPKPATKAVDAKSAPGASVSGRVTLSPAIASKASPQDTLFIVARAVNGPRIPLAVLRKRVSDLPVEFTLDDAMAMSPELKLSGFPEVSVTARISKSGNAIAQSGDLQGVSAPVKVGAKGIAIAIGSVVP